MPPMRARSRWILFNLLIFRVTRRTTSALRSARSSQCMSGPTSTVFGPPTVAAGSGTGHPEFGEPREEAQHDQDDRDAAGDSTDHDHLLVGTQRSHGNFQPLVLSFLMASTISWRTGGLSLGLWKTLGSVVQWSHRMHLTPWWIARVNSTPYRLVNGSTGPRCRMIVTIWPLH